MLLAARCLLREVCHPLNVAPSRARAHAALQSRASPAVCLLLLQVHKLCKQHNALLICDEIQTGLARTGKMLCSEHWGVKPDVLVRPVDPIRWPAAPLCPPCPPPPPPPLSVWPLWIAAAMVPALCRGRPASRAAHTERVTAFVWREAVCCTMPCAC